MAQRITITIPDDLHERLQAVKDRINVSGVCQEAIMKVVASEELKYKDIPEMDKLIERLRKEREEAGEDWKKRGLEDGRTDALELSYGDFRGIENNHDSLPPQGLDLDTRMIEGVMEGEEEWLSERVSEMRSEEPAFEEETYLAAWLDGVMEVWKEVKRKL